MPTKTKHVSIKPSESLNQNRNHHLTIAELVKTYSLRRCVRLKV